jgi:hypothetical protein
MSMSHQKIYLFIAKTKTKKSRLDASFSFDVCRRIETVSTNSMEYKCDQGQVE